MNDKQRAITQKHSYLPTDEERLAQRLVELTLEGTISWCLFNNPVTGEAAHSGFYEGTKLRAYRNGWGVNYFRIVVAAGTEIALPWLNQTSAKAFFAFIDEQADELAESNLQAALTKFGVKHSSS